MVRGGAISPIELVTEHLREIDRRNPAPQRVRHRARRKRAGRRPRRETRRRARRTSRPPSRRPRHRQGQLRCRGSAHPRRKPSSRAGHRAGQDAAAVARLRAEGAILLGKTNTPELLASYETDNFLTGRTNHPLDPRTHARRIERRRGRGHRSVLLAGRARQRWRRIHPRSRPLLRHRRPEAYPRPHPRAPATSRSWATPAASPAWSAPWRAPRDDLRLLFSVLAGYAARGPVLRARAPPRAPYRPSPRGRVGPVLLRARGSARFATPSGTPPICSRNSVCPWNPSSHAASNARPTCGPSSSASGPPRR